MSHRLSVFRPVLVCLAIIAVATLRISLSSAESDKPPLRIGVSLGLTGTYATISDMQSKAYRLWERHVNERGGILGRRVEIIIRNDNSDPQVGKTIYEDFIRKDKMDFVFGPYSSAITSTTAPIAEQHGYPMIAPGAASDELWKRGYSNLFGTIPPAGRYAVGFMAMMSETGIKRIAVVYADDEFSMSFAEGTKRWAGEYGLQITSYEKFVKGTVNLEKEIKAARQSGAQVLLVGGHLDEAVNVRRALKHVGWTPTAYYASIGPGLDQYQTQLGAAADAEGTYSTSIWEAREDLKLPGAADFLHAFVRAYNEKPSYQAAQAYAAGQILEHAIQKAGTTERAAVREALFLLDTNILLGRYVVDRTGVQTKRFPMIIQWQKGRREIVWPPEVRTAAPVVPRRT